MVYHQLLFVPKSLCKLLCIVCGNGKHSPFSVFPLLLLNWRTTHKMRLVCHRFKTVLRLQTYFMKWHHVVYTHMHMHAQWFVSWKTGMWGENVIAVCDLNFLTIVSLNFVYIILCTVLRIFMFWNWVALTIISHVQWNLICLDFLNADRV